MFDGKLEKKEGLFIDDSSIYPMIIRSKNNVIQTMEVGEPYMNSDCILSHALRDDMILPQYCRMVREHDNGGYVFVMEIPPKIQTIKCSESLMNIEKRDFIMEFGGTDNDMKLLNESYAVTNRNPGEYNIKLQFPWTIFIIDTYLRSGFMTIGHLQVYFSKVAISNVNTPLFIPPLPNIHSDRKMCIPHATASSDLPQLISDQISIFWDSVFNTDLMEHKRTYEEHHTHTSNILKWSLESLVDPLFIFKEPLKRETSLSLLLRKLHAPKSAIMRRLNPDVLTPQYISSITMDDGISYYRGDLITVNDTNYYIDKFVDKTNTVLRDESSSELITMDINSIHQEYLESNEVISQLDTVDVHGLKLKIGQMIRLRIEGMCIFGCVIEDIGFDKRIGSYKIKVHTRNRGYWMVLSQYLIDHIEVIDVKPGDIIFTKSGNEILIDKVCHVGGTSIELTSAKLYIDTANDIKIEKYTGIESLGLEDPIELTTTFKYLGRLYIPRDNGRCRYLMSNKKLYILGDMLRPSSNITCNDITDVLAIEYLDLDTNKTITFKVGELITYPNGKGAKISIGEIVGIITNSKTARLIVKDSNDITSECTLLKYDYSNAGHTAAINPFIQPVIRSFKIDFNNSISIGDKVRSKITGIPYIKKSEVLEIIGIIPNKQTPIEVYLSNGRSIILSDLIKYFTVYSQKDPQFTSTKNILKFIDRPVVAGDYVITGHNWNPDRIEKIYPVSQTYRAGNYRINIWNTMTKPAPTEIPEIIGEHTNGTTGETHV